MHGNKDKIKEKPNQKIETEMNKFYVFVKADLKYKKFRRYKKIEKEAEEIISLHV